MKLQLGFLLIWKRHSTRLITASSLKSFIITVYVAQLINGFVVTWWIDTNINGTNSDYMNVLCGVPQGSILGPILFILYINDMCNVSTLLKPILFADDTNLFYSGKDIDELCSVVSIELDKLCIWFQVNKLSLNTSKTNFMIIHKQKLRWYIFCVHEWTKFIECLSQNSWVCIWTLSLIGIIIVAL